MKISGSDCTNALRFEYVNAGVCSMVSSFREERHLTSTMVLSQLCRGKAHQVLDGKPYTKEAGMCTFIPDSAVTECAVTGTPILIRWLHFNVYYRETIPLSRLFEFPVLFSPNMDRALGDYLERLLALRQDTNSVAAAVERTMIGWEIINKLMTVSVKRSTFAATLNGERRLANVFAYCEKHLADAVPVSKLAKLAHLSVPRFHCLFRELTGLSPHAYIMRLRLKRSAELLRDSAMTVEAVSEETGFYDRYHLGKQFKRLYGVSPVQYRKKAYIL